MGDRTLRRSFTTSIALSLVLSLAVLGSVSGDTGPRQSSSVDITVNPSLRQVDPGSAAIFDLELKNLGTSQDVFSLEVSNLPRNWTALFSDMTIDMGQGETNVAALTIRPPTDALAARIDISLTATSEVDGSSDSSQLSVTVKQIFKLDLTIDPIPSVTAGGSTSFDVTVLNRGNGPDTVTLTMIPMGDTASWSQTSSRKIDLEPGTSTTNRLDVGVPTDTDPGSYSYTIRARSSGAGVDETKMVNLEVKGSPSSGFKLELWMIIVLMILMAMVLAILTARYTPSRPGTDQKPIGENQGTGAERKKVRKVRKKKRETAVDDEHKERLERIEKRIEHLHEHVMDIHKSHHQFMDHFQLHLIGHHGMDGEGVDLTKSDEGPPSVEEAREPGDMELDKVPVTPEVEMASREMEPSPPSEGLPPVGPPESMSVGDEHGELRAAPMTCPRCEEKIEPDWVRCANCGYLLPSKTKPQNR